MTKRVTVTDPIGRYANAQKVAAGIKHAVSALEQALGGATFREGRVIREAIRSLDDLYNKSTSLRISMLEATIEDGNLYPKQWINTAESWGVDIEGFEPFEDTYRRETKK
jgi:hypothetical protein